MTAANNSSASPFWGVGSSARATSVPSSRTMPAASFVPPISTATTVELMRSLRRDAQRDDAEVVGRGVRNERVVDEFVAQRVDGIARVFLHAFFQPCESVVDDAVSTLDQAVGVADHER